MAELVNTHSVSNERVSYMTNTGYVYLDTLISGSVLSYAKCKEMNGNYFWLKMFYILGKLMTTSPINITSGIKRSKQ